MTARPPVQKIGETIEIVRLGRVDGLPDALSGVTVLLAYQPITGDPDRVRGALDRVVVELPVGPTRIDLSEPDRFADGLIAAADELDRTGMATYTHYEREPNA